MTTFTHFHFSKNRADFRIAVIVFLSLFLSFFSKSQAQTTKPIIVITPTSEKYINIDSIVDLYKDSGPTKFKFAPGFYRLTGPITAKAGDEFIGTVGADSEKLSLLNGSIELKKESWAKVGQYWVYDSLDVPIAAEDTMFTACTKNYYGCKYPEELFRDRNSIPILRDTLLTLVRPGYCFYNYKTATLYMYDDPTTVNDDPIDEMEFSTIRGAFSGLTKDSPNNITVQNLIIEKFAIPGHATAVNRRNGADWIIENNEVRWNHGTGVRFTGRAKVTNNYVHHNGQMGLSGGGTGGLVEGNEIAYNVYAKFNWSAEGGGTKFARTDSLMVRNNNVHHNNGPGLWTDVLNRNTIYEGNTCTDNLASGIFHEISYDAIIRCNTLARNGSRAQLFISNSSNVEVYNNTITTSIGKGDAILISQGYRPGFLGRNNYVHHNYINYGGSKKQTISKANYKASDFWKTGNTRFDYNTYAATSLTAWQWADVSLTWNDFQLQGQEINGVINDYVFPSSTCSVTNPIMPYRAINLNGAAVTIDGIL